MPTSSCVVRIPRFMVGHKKASKPSKCINPCQLTLQKLCTFGSSQVTQRFRFVMVRQVFPEITIYQESQLATSVRDMCPSRRPMRLGARHRRLLDTGGLSRPRCLAGARADHQRITTLSIGVCADAILLAVDSPFGATLYHVKQQDKVLLCTCVMERIRRESKHGKEWRKPKSKKKGGLSTQGRGRRDRSRQAFVRSGAQAIRRIIVPL